MGFRTRLQIYYRLSKPGIIYANILTAAAGYLVGSRFHIRPSIAFSLLVGTGLVIAGACACNNVLDRRIDARMARTSKRSLVTGKVRARSALLFAGSATGLGIGLLAMTQNWLTSLLIAIAFVDYVLLYGWGKRHSVHGTLIGCISGAIPLVAGYTAVHGRLDVTAGLLFLLMVAWQMGHFYGIALYRLEDYQRAELPVMPAVHGTRSTQHQTLGYIILFTMLSLALWPAHVTGVIGAFALATTGLYWLIGSWRTLDILAAPAWGKRTFLTSLTVMLAMCVLLPVGALVGR